MNRQRNAWTTHEIALVSRYYATRMPAAELAALLPRHPWSSIKAYGNKTLGLRRPPAGRPAPTWLRMRALLIRTPMTLGELASALEFSKARASELAQRHRAELRIVRWEWPDGLGRPSPVWTVGSGPDARRPLGERTSSRQMADPFAQLVAQVSA